MPLGFSQKKSLLFVNIKCEGQIKIHTKVKGQMSSKALVAVHFSPYSGTFEVISQFFL